MASLAELARDIALQRSLLLYRLAVEAARGGDYDHARRLVEHALELLKRMRLRKPYPLRRLVCRNCGAPLSHGVTARVRLREGRVVVTCLLCGYIRRFPFRAPGERGAAGPRAEEA